MIPKGLNAISLIVARDFGTQGGIFHGTITSVGMEERRTHYHVRYDDGDEEDYDYAELEYAVELQQLVALGTYKGLQQNIEDTDDDEGSVYIPSDDSDAESLETIVTTTKKGASKQKRNENANQTSHPLTIFKMVKTKHVRK